MSSLGPEQASTAPTVPVPTAGGEGPELPFGGAERSGSGRELGPLAMDELADRRLLYVR